MSHADAHDHDHNMTVPKGAIVGAFILILFAIVTAAVARQTGIGAVRLDKATMVQSMTLRFEDRTDGGVSVLAGDSGNLVGVFEAGSDGFIRTMLRSLAFERQRRAIGSAPAFTLTRWSDGQTTIEDPSTGRRIELAAFGQANVQALTRMMSTGGDKR